MAVLKPQPEVHIRGDLDTEYLNVGKVVEAAQKAGILKVGFITKKPLGRPVESGQGEAFHSGA